MMATTIWKFTIQPGDMVIRMPVGAVILDVQAQRDESVMWAIVDPDAPLEDVRLVIRGTGQNLDGWESKDNYVGSFQPHGYTLVYHVFKP